MIAFFIKLAKNIFSVFLNILPILVVVTSFQLFVIKQPFPDIASTISGMILVLVGLFFFIQGLEIGLFPIGEKMAFQFSAKGNIWWLLIFGFAIGFSTTIAEPALIAIAKKAGEIAAEASAIPHTKESIASYAFWLRMTVALSVGSAISVGVLRIVKGWPVHWFIIIGYIFIIILTNFAPKEIVGIAYDSGGVTTSCITVPLVAALGVGLATCIRGRNPIVDGFGLIAFASLTPIFFVMLYGIIIY
ncbi:MAG: DUF1538 domain-containing protein [Candidatus Scalindua rubra]|uniref:DUF1538 domain-containing protein n=1 Tax=Candidatus Scalindua brodae TaxID=237368 RepID=A0A0B0EC91_9BACT|nr:MAG: hypothetical protein SCABRO_03951 [Candidatus Scalindua brodae]MBZ0110213.1 DUF1538 domain-containing protein [Candidatus Scalindua rubra]TWU29025.1 hypothetical protein S225a_26630 [Candidatus Brocadiaceae bacterium S225]